MTMTDPSTSLAPPLDGAAAALKLEMKLQDLFVLDEQATATHPVLRGLHSLDIDEVAVLSADTEELLSGIDPFDSVVFVDGTDLIAARHFSSACSTGSAFDSSGDDPSVSEASSNSTQSKPLVKRDRRCGHRSGAVRNPSRERMQSEIGHLRQQVLNLETQLQSEHEKKASSSVWKRIAKRQLSACERAGKENKRLKSTVELQKELVVGMEDMLYNWQQAATPSPVLLETPVHTLMPHKNVHLEPGDILLFEMLVSELDATYLKIDDAFQDAGIDQPGSRKSFTRATPKSSTSGAGALRSYLELVEVEVSPFAFDLVNRAAMICGEKQSKSSECVVYNGDWGFEDIATQKHRVKRVCDGGVEIYLYMLMALKMYTFEDEVVCVWRSIFKSDKQFPDAYVQEMGWFTSENLASQRISSTSSTTGSLTRLCVHLEPKSFRTPTTVIKAEADVVVNHVVSCYRDVLDETNEMMENLLIQESSNLPAL